MSTTNTSPIPQNLETADKLIMGRSGAEVFLFLGIPIGVTLLAYTFGIFTLIQYLTVIGAIIVTNGLLFKAVPRNESAVHYVKSWYRNYTTADISPSVDYAQEDIDLTPYLTTMTTADRDATESDAQSLLDIGLWEDMETAQESTWVESIHDEDGFIRRTDDVIVGIAQVEGRDVTLSEDARNGTITTSFAKAIAQLDEPTDFYITSVPYDIDDHREHYESRLTDEDVANRPILQEIGRGYVHFVDKSVRQMNMTDRRMFVVRRVDLNNIKLNEHTTTKLEQLFDFIDHDSPIGKRLQGTKLGAKIGIGNAGGDLDGESRIELAKDQLDEEMGQAMRAMNNVSGIRTKRLSGGELADLVRMHWNPTLPISSRWQAPRVPFPRQADEMPVLRDEVGQ